MLAVICKTAYRVTLLQRNPERCRVLKDVDLRVDVNKEATNKITLMRCSFEFMKITVSTLKTTLRFDTESRFELIISEENVSLS